MKFCNRCHTFKDLKEFHIDKSKRDGRKSICKECRKVKNKIIKENHRKLDRNLTKSINLSIRNNRSGRWERILDFTYEELIQHLEASFENNMNWNNYGSYWIIDKIIPTSIYRYSNMQANEFKKAWSLKNFRPIEKKEVVKKKDKILVDLIKEYSLFDILPIGLMQIEGDLF